MAISRVTVWSSNQQLTAAALNAEFNNIINNALSAVSPWTGNMAAGGNLLTGLGLGAVSGASLSATGNAATGIYFSSANAVDIAANGVRAASFGTVSSGVNYLQIGPAATTANVTLQALGSDTNPGIDIISKGTGQINFKRAAGATTDGQMASGVFLWGAGTSTGTNAGDIAVKNTGAYRFVNAAGTSTANYAIHGSADNNMEFETPAAGNAFFNWYSSGTIRMSFRTENSGMGIFFNAAASGDHSAPASPGQCVLYVKDAGGGKSVLVARFASGTVQTVATEP
jgi:hypothetical protein